MYEKIQLVIKTTVKNSGIKKKFLEDKKINKDFRQTRKMIIYKRKFQKNLKENSLQEF